MASDGCDVVKFELNHLQQPVGEVVIDWNAPPVPSRDALQGRSCRLEALSPDAHAASLFAAYQQDAAGANWTYLPYGPFARFDEFHDWVAAQCVVPDPLLFAIISSSSDEALGVAGYLRISPAAGSIEVGHLNYSPRLQQTVAATEAMFLMMRRAFELGYRRYEWKCNALNAASCRAAERLGFSFEGIFRQATVVKGRNRDTAWFSIIDSEWPALQTAFQQWLDPANFDEHGRQRVRLSDLTASIVKRRMES